MATYVLIHGAYHGGWCWDETASLLRAKSHQVYAPTLPGLAERHAEVVSAINLSTHVSEVEALFDSQDLSDVILVGHSYGGMVITGLAARLGSRIRTLVYLDGILPTDGQSLFDVVGDEVTLKTIARTRADGVLVDVLPAEFFDVDPTKREWVDSKLTPHPLATFIEAVHFTGLEREVRNHTYVVATDYHFRKHHEIAAKLERDDGWRVKRIAAGHDVMVDQPASLAELLLEEAEFSL